jgi:predicted transposase/invertase (TIGR01784 family)
VREQVEILVGEEIKTILKEKNVFPKYYFINVEKYKNIINRNIDEWIYMLKNSEIKAGSKSKNIDKAAKKLEILNMSEEGRKNYERYLINVARERDMLQTAKDEGKAERDIEIAQKLIQKGFSDEEIQEVTGLEFEVIQKLRVF